MTAADKAEFLERTKQSMLQEQGIPWEFVEAKIIEDIENTFDDEKFAKMNPDFRKEAIADACSGSNASAQLTKLSKAIEAISTIIS